MSEVVPAIAASLAAQANLSLPLPTGAPPAAPTGATPPAGPARTPDQVTLSAEAPLRALWAAATAGLQTLATVLPRLERALQQARPETQAIPLGQMAKSIGDAAKQISAFPTTPAPLQTPGETSSRAPAAVTNAASTLAPQPTSVANPAAAPSANAAPSSAPTTSAPTTSAPTTSAPTTSAPNSTALNPAPNANTPVPTSVTAPLLPLPARAGPADSRPLTDATESRNATLAPTTAQPDRPQAASHSPTSTPANPATTRLQASPAASYAAFAEFPLDRAPPAGQALERWRLSASDTLQTASGLLDRVEQAIQPPPNVHHLVPTQLDPAMLWALGSVATARRDVDIARNRLSPGSGAGFAQGAAALGTLATQLARLRLPIALLGAVILTLIVWLSGAAALATAALITAAATLFWTARLLRAARHFHLATRSAPPPKNPSPAGGRGPGRG